MTQSQYAMREVDGAGRETKPWALTRLLLEKERVCSCGKSWPPSFPEDMAQAKLELRCTCGNVAVLLHLERV